jgi:hypothetical protein
VAESCPTVIKLGLLQKKRRIKELPGKLLAFWWSLNLLRSNKKSPIPLWVEIPSTRDSDLINWVSIRIHIFMIYLTTLLVSQNVKVGMAIRFVNNRLNMKGCKRKESWPICLEGLRKQPATRKTVLWSRLEPAPRQNGKQKPHDI